MKYKIVVTGKFKEDLKLAKKRGYNLNLPLIVVDMLAAGEPLPESYKDHNLTGNYAGCRECHITPDWLLIYEIVESELILYLTRTGTHSDLFLSYGGNKYRATGFLNPFKHSIFSQPF